MRTAKKNADSHSPLVQDERTPNANPTSSREVWGYPDDLLSAFARKEANHFFCFYRTHRYQKQSMDGRADSSGCTAGFLSERCVRRALSATPTKGVHPANALPQVDAAENRSFSPGRLSDIITNRRNITGSTRILCFRRTRVSTRTHAGGPRNVCDTATVPGISISRVEISSVTFSVTLLPEG